jgi:hypothetical protein
LVWPTAAKNKKTTLERYFLKKEDYQKLCTELAGSPIEGVCGCLYDTSANLPPEIYPCTMRDPTVFEEDMSRERIRYLQTRNWSQCRWVENQIADHRCKCEIYSSIPMFAPKKQDPEQNRINGRIVDGRLQRLIDLDRD